MGVCDVSCWGYDGVPADLLLALLGYPSHSSMSVWLMRLAEKEAVDAGSNVHGADVGVSGFRLCVSEGFVEHISCDGGIVKLAASVEEDGIGGSRHIHKEMDPSRYGVECVMQILDR